MRRAISGLIDRWRVRRDPSTTVCLIIKDEGRYLAEWLAHYLTLGFDRIVIYDNDSGPETLAIERRCAEADPRITVIPWPDAPGKFAQLTAYEDALKRCSTDWIAFFDTDEFLVLKTDASIQSYLKRAPAKAGAVCINWVVFGSSGEAHYRPEPVTRRFRRCSLTSPVNEHVKCIVRKAGAKRMNHPHSPRLRRRFSYVDGDLTPFELDRRAFNPNHSYETAQLNHYVLRSREEYQEKLRRGMPEPKEGGWKYAKFADPDAFWSGHDLGETEDRSIDSWTDKASVLRSEFWRSLEERRKDTANTAHSVSAMTEGNAPA
ncbi:MAG: glycosyltransferase family 2 protein [Proteobacteria bacterium]|nr:glycosyltransferase family 2 protein [Pseudomonadota bacterium]